MNLHAPTVMEFVAFAGEWIVGSLVGVAVLLTIYLLFSIPRAIRDESDAADRARSEGRASRDGEVETMKHRIAGLQSEVDHLQNSIRRLEDEKYDLTVRLNAMPRKPLTDDQLRASLAEGGNRCPRCTDDNFAEVDSTGNDGPLSVGDLPDGIAAAVDRKCDSCGEKWRVYMRPASIAILDDDDDETQGPVELPKAIAESKGA